MASSQFSSRLASSPRDVVGGGVLRIDLDLFLEFLLGPISHLGVGIGTREQSSAQQEVRPGRVGLLLDHVFVFVLGFVPLALHFQRFGIQLMRGDRLWGVGGEILGGPSGEIRIGVHHDEEHVWILGKLLAERPDKIHRGVTIIDRERAAESEDADFFLRPRRSASLLIPRFRVGRASLQCPSSPRVMALSTDNDEAASAGCAALGACAKSGSATVRRR